MINLEKGQRISMDKGLSLVGVGLGWDPNEGSGYDFDLDASAFMLGENGQIPQQEFFVFYGNQKAPDGSVESTGDDLTGGNSDGGDDETLNVDLTKVSPQIQEIIRHNQQINREQLLLPEFSVSKYHLYIYYILSSYFISC